MQAIQDSDHLRRYARLFGARLSEVMTGRGIGQRQLLKFLPGGSRSTLRQYLAGYNLPSFAAGMAIATALDDERLAELIRIGRTLRCRTCGSRFVNETSGPARYCSDACRVIAGKKRVGDDTRRRADVAEERLAEAMGLLTEHQGAVEGMCHSCEPEGFCRMPECHLRALSPLPLATSSGAEAARPAAGPWGAENRERLLAAIRRANAERWSRPGEREAQSERTRRRHERDRVRRPVSAEMPT